FNHVQTSHPWTIYSSPTCIEPKSQSFNHKYRDQHKGQDRKFLVTRTSVQDLSTSPILVHRSRNFPQKSKSDA
ncbi:hypothetical protein VIGAN_07076600, partial [Vigna angularis var. angularis]